MKLLFICGSIEPGRDGVGDYTRKLCKELIKRGVETGILSFNDAYVKGFIKTFQWAEEVKIPVLRIGNKIATNLKLSAAKEWVEEMNPAILSLQFVPFSFNSKGIPWGLQHTLYDMGNGRKWHIMFHELWVEGKSIKYFLWAAIQKEIIRQILRKLDPTMAHTHVPIYLERLVRFKISINPLPIFSNLPISLKNGQTEESPGFIIGFFSQFQSSFEILDFLHKFSEDLTKKNIRTTILLVGGSSNKERQLKNDIKKILGEDVKIITTGFLEATDASDSIRKCNLCITPVPRHLLGKSGSVAACLSHGIPVAAPNVKPRFRELGIGFFDKDLSNTIVNIPNLWELKKSKEALQRSGKKLHISHITEQFIKDLQIH